jgi:hypothetical protein
MTILKKAAFAALGMALAGPVHAADFSDPTWPCIQRKVENLSIGLMWPEEIPEADLSPEQALAVRELADRLALRRVTLEEAEEAVMAFRDTHGADPALMGQVFAQVFKSLSTRRSRIINGIGDFSLGQIALSERIDAARTEMDAQMAKDDPDFDRVDSLEEQVDWDQRIFNDRQKTITYLCETPTLLDKRLYAIAQILTQASRDG